MHVRKKDNRMGVLEKAAEMFCLPEEVLIGLPKIVMTGNRRIQLEYHKGLLEYSESLIIINCGKSLLRVKGDNMEIVSMTAEELLITGLILSFEFE